METAIDSHDNIRHIRSVINADGKVERVGFRCKCCNTPAIVAFGSKRQYFKHRNSSKECIAAKHEKHMTEWHRSWQDLFPEGTQEHYEKAEDGKLRIADVFLENYVVEFQHSAITDEEVESRTSFYEKLGKKVIWLFDLRETWSIQDFRQSTYEIEGIKLLKLSSKSKMPCLPRGMVAINTTKTILFAEIAGKGEGTTIIRLFKWDNDLLAVNYGSSHEKLADSIISGKIKHNLTITNIMHKPTKGKAIESSQKQKHILDKIRTSINSEDDNSTHDLFSAYNSEYTESVTQESKGSFVRIRCTSNVEMTFLIEPFLKKGNCTIISQQYMISSSDKCVIEYTIETSDQSRKDVLNYLRRLARVGEAPLFGGEFE